MSNTVELVDITRVGNSSHTIRCGVGESPVWLDSHQAWFWVDIIGRTIWSSDATGSHLQSWQTAEMIGCLTPTRSTTANAGQPLEFIAGMESGIFTLVLEKEGKLSSQHLAAPAELQPGMRFNDGRCDRQGRFWSGTMLIDMSEPRAAGHLYRYSAEQGVSAPVVSNLLVQNGLAWSPDGRTMYLSDSHPNSQLIWAFDYDTDSGTPHNQRVLVDMKNYDGRPDGAAIDVDGCYWICGNDAGRILRFTPDGKLDRQIAVPMAKPTMCCFGGANMDTLMVASIAAGQSQDDVWAGATVLLRPGVQGFAETAFAT
ncbi:SMP-30/gluconolactonase/LRE family protein [Undibacterium danionis]|uniref:SMP-30/gluconolactonase/LRE family protein n=1 Tax=Undibacterium danionis TaxID=1812100 RepID=A0ABV6IJK3_9BURK